MPRKYELKKRAERQAETRRRIVEAAVHLHRTRGPARTSFSDVARAAGVERHTLYRHFPDERALFMACSGHFYEENPPPDPERWLEVEDPHVRLRQALGELYAFFDRGSDMFACVYRDAEVHAPTRETVELRSGGRVRRIHAVLSDGLPRRKRVQAALELAIGFRTWQALVERGGLSNDEAAELMADVVCAQAGRARRLA
ncbi:MAG TPA: helix-turn-helix domain-containing protein [Gaiellaceae bacterium]|nr:helix-turn-helix domain-containing protein [Gaiellaceae bacterium]